jgi:PAS domain-containing protein
METVPMLDYYKRQSGWLAVFRDITERRRQELEYRTIIQTMSEGFCILDTDGRFLDVNDAYCRISGYSREELLK